ncbi:MAG: phenylalanine--tRNA ligase subunit beta [Phycisphaerae bacterium]
MKVSFNWLKDYVEIDLPAMELAEKLIHTGFNIESIKDLPADILLDLEVTSNRPDCLGHIGIARETAAILGKELKLPSVEYAAAGRPVTAQTVVEVVAPKLCPRYVARVINNVKIGPSPKWIVDRLEAIGIRSINNVVDITNYVLMETGQPLHAFDLDKLSGRKIIVRPAKPGERFVAIDHSAHELDSETLVIADAERAVALAGIMGGINSEVSESTKDILLESAEFDPVCIRRTARKFNLHSDSSYRFERRIDPVNVDWASRRAVDLIVRLCGGEAAQGEIDVWTKPVTPTKIELKFKKIKDVLGIEVEIPVVLRILKSLGFAIEGHDSEKMTVLSLPFRAEVSRPIDLVEEIGRIVGLNKIPTVDSISITAVSSSRMEKMTRLVHQALNQCGFSEAVTVTLVEPKFAALFTDVPSDNVLRVASTRRQVNDALRCSLIPSLLSVRVLNQDAGNAVSDVYEIARTYRPNPAGKLPLEEKHLAILSSLADVRSVRGTLELMFRLINSPEKIRLVSKPMPWFLPDQSAQVFLGSRPIGIIGTINPETQKIFDLKKPSAVAEINFDVMTDLPFEPAVFSPLPKFPAIERDLSIIVDEQVSWETIERVILGLRISDLESIDFGELFRGKQIPKGQKSLFFTLRYRNLDRSLTHEEVDADQQRVIQALAESCKAQLRTI